jgi:diacylglycerol kinase
MLAMEIMNSAIELLCDRIEPSYDVKIGQIKDIAATAAGVSILIWVIIIVYDGSIAIQNALTLL